MPTLVGLRAYLVFRYESDSAVTCKLPVMRTSTGREINREKKGPANGASNMAMAKNMKESVNRWIVTIVGHRQKNR